MENKMKKFILAIALAVLFVACSDNNITTSPEDTSQKGGDVLQSDCSLELTFWKLTAFVDIVNGTTYVPENWNPKEIGKDYILTFTSEDMFRGHGFHSALAGQWSVDCTDLSINMFNNIIYYGEGDDLLYAEAIFAAETFTQSANTLKLFYDGGKKYLLFESLD